MSFATVSYGAAAFLYGALALLLLFGRRSAARAWALASSLVASAVWAGTTAWLGVDGPGSAAAFAALESLHLLALIVCAVAWLDGDQRRWLFGTATAVCVASIIAASAAEWGFGPRAAAYLGLIAASLIGMASLYPVVLAARVQATAEQRMLCIAVAAILALDAVLYAQRMLQHPAYVWVWSGRGTANVMLLPLIVFGFSGSLQTGRSLFLSRQIVFFVASVCGVGAYLVVMGALPSLLIGPADESSLPYRILFVCSGALLLALALLSPMVRTRLRVFLVKHFYRHKYDYREEWLRLTATLGQATELRPALVNALQGLARIIGSREGGLWLERNGQRYEHMVSMDADAVPTEAHYDTGHPMVSFLRTLKWVIDSDEYRQNPDRYGRSFGDPEASILPESSIIVPLDCLGHLQGFVILRKPVNLQTMNFEDHDILKTAGWQIAVVVAQALNHERLAEARQFEAMSRLTAFLMHDLKNIVAQQELVVANAQRFRHRPEFIDDAFGTIHAGVERMKRLLDQLNARGIDRGTGRVEVAKVLAELRSSCADREPVPRIDIPEQPIWVNTDRERLANALAHLVRNAQDATPPKGAITVTVATGNGEAVISVADTGCGMDPVFVRERLFRPFDSTKGAQGMGIGAYQVRHLARTAGGDVEVVSEPGQGTTFRVRLPIAGAAR